MPAWQHEENRAIAYHHETGSPVESGSAAPAATEQRHPVAGDGNDLREGALSGNLAPDALKQLVEGSLDDDKAQAVTSIDLTEKSTIADHMIIASGTSRRQVSAMADHLMQRLKDAGVKRALIDGEEQGDWVLIDAGDVIVHLFRPEVRAFYNLEKMWGADVPDLARNDYAAEPEAVLEA